MEWVNWRENHRLYVSRLSLENQFMDITCVDIIASDSSPLATYALIHGRKKGAKSPF